MQLATAAGARSMRAPSASSRSAEPDLLVAERLPCLATAQPAPAAISAAVVETLNELRPAAGAGGVEQIVAFSGHMGGESTHRARQAGDLLHRLPLGPQGDEEAGDLRLGDLSVHDLSEHLGCLLGAQVRARGERIDRSCQGRVGHQLSRKLPEQLPALFGENRLRMELHALGG